MAYDTSQTAAEVLGSQLGLISLLGQLSPPNPTPETPDPRAKNIHSESAAFDTLVWLNLVLALFSGLGFKSWQTDLSGGYQVSLRQKAGATRRPGNSPDGSGKLEEHEKVPDSTSFLTYFFVAQGFGIFFFLGKRGSQKAFNEVINLMYWPIVLPFRFVLGRFHLEPIPNF